MKKKEDEGRRISLRIPSSLADEVESHIEITGMSFTEFFKRALREKLNRDNGARGGNTEKFVTHDELEQRIKQLETQTITQTNSGNGAKQSLKIKK